MVVLSLSSKKAPTTTVSPEIETVSPTPGFTIPVDFTEIVEPAPVRTRLIPTGVPVMIAAEADGYRSEELELVAPRKQKEDLVLSALGGSMFPSFLMPERLQEIGRLTFNAWAVDGYQAVFWYEAGVAQLAPQVGVLLGFCLAFLAAARGLARRWQVV